MRLQSLRPKHGADLHELQARLKGRGWQSAVPTALPDPVLLMLARDFRAVEESFSTERCGAESKSSIATALYVTMNLLMQHPARAAPGSEVQLSESGMMHALQAYQWNVEREVVGRIIGIGQGPADQNHSLLEELWQCMHE